MMAAGPLTLDEAVAVIESRPPPEPQSQAAPAPDYGSLGDQPEAPGDVEPCSCDEALALREQVARLSEALCEWESSGKSVGVNCPGAMQQAKHMAAAACGALGLTYVETAPSDIREAVMRLSESAKDYEQRWLKAERDCGAAQRETAQLLEALRG